MANPAITYPVTYNGIDLAQTIPGLQVTMTNANEMPEAAVTISALARSDRSIFLAKFYPKKAITIKAIITSATVVSLEVALDSLKALLSPTEKALVIQQSGADRVYTASLQALKIAEKQGSYALVDIQFICSYPVGSATTASTLLASTINMATSPTYSVTVVGSYQAEPTITVTIGAVTGATNQTITVTDLSSGQGLAVTRTWAVGDVLVINSLNQIVTVGGGVVDYSGKFPAFAPGNQSLVYTDTFTTRTVTIRATYTARYL